MKWQKRGDQKVFATFCPPLFCFEKATGRSCKIKHKMLCWEKLNLTEGKYTVAANVTLYAKWTPATNTEYKIEHYQQNTAKTGYTLKETENKTGTTGQAVTGTAKTYTGFTYDSKVEGTIARQIKLVAAPEQNKIKSKGLNILNIKVPFLALAGIKYPFIKYHTP